MSIPQEQLDSMVAVDALLESLAGGMGMCRHASTELRELAYQVARHYPSPARAQQLLESAGHSGLNTPDINAYRRLLGTIPNEEQSK